MNLIEKIQQFNDLKAEISNYFDTPIYDGFDDMTGVTWSLNPDSVRWIGEDDDCEYGEEFRYVDAKKEYTLIKIYACTGETYLAIFDNSKKVEDLDEALDKLEKSEK